MACPNERCAGGVGLVSCALAMSPGVRFATLCVLLPSALVLSAGAPALAQRADPTEASEPAEPIEPAEPAVGEASPGPDEAEEADGAASGLDGSISGEYRHRVVALSDFTLHPLPRTDPALTGLYDANVWGEQAIRLRGELRLRPVLRLFGEADVLWGVAWGDTPVGQEPAAWSRQELGYPGLRLRQLYLEWQTPIGLIRAGQMAFSWGLGMISNGGDNAPVFGDARFGDLVRRVMFATKPGGASSPFSVAVAGDWVAWDVIADHDRRGDLAFQGVLAGLYQEGDQRVGAYVAYRRQQNTLSDTLEVFVGDVFAELYFDEPSGGRVLTAFELAYVRGETSIPRTALHPVQEVEQLMAVARLGRVSEDFDVVFEGGYASGDSNAEDAFQRRGTMDPDHRVGLILFPEVLAAQTARAAALASSPETFGRPSRGAELIPTNGSVAGAYYLFPHVKWRALDWLETRFGAVLAWSSADVTDPYVQRSQSRSVNFRGGDPGLRDLGLELDGSVLLRGPLSQGITVLGGLEGGVLIPGQAFADARGQTMDPVGMLRLRFGLHY